MTTGKRVLEGEVSCKEHPSRTTGINVITIHPQVPMVGWHTFPVDLTVRQTAKSVSSLHKGPLVF